MQELKIEVFIIFDEEDRDLFRELKQHLTPLETQGLITVWDEDQIISGTNKREAIDRHLQSASLVLLLLSAHFMASRESYNLAKRALVLHTPPEGYVVPILLHEVDWDYSDFGHLAPLPTNRKPISSWTNRHAAYLDVVKGIRDIVATYEQSQPFEMNPFNIQSVTITTPDGSKYTADVPADTFVDELLREFLNQWSSSLVGTTRSMHFSLHTENAAMYTLDRSNTLREVGLSTATSLTLVSEILSPDAPIGLTIEDDQGERYITTVLLNTVVGRLAEAFLRKQSSTGQVIAEWILPAAKTKRLKLGETLYNQGVCDDALLRIYRVVTAVEE